MKNFEKFSNFQKLLRLTKISRAKSENSKIFAVRNQKPKISSRLSRRQRKSQAKPETLKRLYSKQELLGVRYRPKSKSRRRRPKKENSESKPEKLDQEQMDILSMILEERKENAEGLAKKRSKNKSSSKSRSRSKSKKSKKSKKNKKEKKAKKSKKRPKKEDMDDSWRMGDEGTEELTDPLPALKKKSKTRSKPSEPKSKPNSKPSKLKPSKPKRKQRSKTKKRPKVKKPKPKEEDLDSVVDSFLKDFEK